jgi:hypothetical protein
MVSIATLLAKAGDDLGGHVGGGWAEVVEKLFIEEVRDVADGVFAVASSAFYRSPLS